MLRYALTKNLLTEDPLNYKAYACPRWTFDKEAIIERMVDKGTTVRRADILAVLTNLEDVITDSVEGGHAITMPLFNLSYSISGTFEGPQDAFNRRRHEIHINLAPGKLLRKLQKRLKVEKTHRNTPGPNITQLSDIRSGSMNELLSPGSSLRIYGSRLKIAGSNPQTGVYFEDEQGNATKVNANNLIVNHPSQLVVQIPALPPGKYRVQVATQYNGSGRSLNTPRGVHFHRVLTVQ